jgi:hypothetical protein
MSDLMKKIGMNSQTLRVVMKSPTEKITKDGIVDFHITDGSTASHFMELMGSFNPTGYMTQHLSAYEIEAIALETDPMSWGGPNDKMTDINFTEINVVTLPLTSDRNSPSAGGYRGQSMPLFSVPARTTRVQPFTAYPVRSSLLPVSSTTTDTDDNKTNFGKLFGK